VAAIKEPTEERSQKELEIIELEALLPEMQAKIEDSRDQMNALQTPAEPTEEVNEPVVIDKPVNGQTKPVSDITHLVKRKRPLSGNDPEPKKQCGSGDEPQQPSQNAQ